jgi:hypothetical protein
MSIYQKLERDGQKRGGPTGIPYITPLKDLCIQVVADHFEQRPKFGNLPEKYVVRVIEKISLDLPLELVGTLIHDEPYWKRRSCMRWKNCQVSPMSAQPHPLLQAKLQAVHVLYILRLARRQCEPDAVGRGGVWAMLSR